eukprot:scaffold2623_cov78-Phaeocystis_antarctica.AAC.2
MSILQEAGFKTYIALRLRARARADTRGARASAAGALGARRGCAEVGPPRGGWGRRARHAGQARPRPRAPGTARRPPPDCRRQQTAQTAVSAIALRRTRDSCERPVDRAGKRDPRPP